MRHTVTEPMGDYFIVKIVDDNGRTIRRKDGSERFADSRYHKDPYATVEKPSGVIRYSSKGIV